MPRCKICRIKFEPKYFLEKTCSKDCEKQFRKEQPKKQLKKVSDKRKKEEYVYSLVRKSFLKNNTLCQSCGSPATEIHHKDGREGARLNYTPMLMAICRKCHTWIHNNPKEARLKEWMI